MNDLAVADGVLRRWMAWGTIAAALALMVLFVAIHVLFEQGADLAAKASYGIGHGFQVIAFTGVLWAAVSSWQYVRSLGRKLETAQVELEALRGGQQ